MARRTKANPRQMELGFASSPTVADPSLMTFADMFFGALDETWVPRGLGEWIAINREKRAAL